MGQRQTNWLRKRQIWFTDRARSQQATGAGICNYQSEIEWQISLGRDATAFQAEVAAILDCVISCLKKGLVKERITICSDSQAAVAALAASDTKSLHVADCIEKLTVLSEVNYVTGMWVPRHSGIQQNEIANRLAREGARTRLIGREPFLPLSLSRFKPK